MKNTMKHKYVPCQLDVVEFKVERGFALSNGQGDQEPRMVGAFANSIANHEWYMNKNDNGHYQNEQFGDGTINWFE